MVQACTEFGAHEDVMSVPVPPGYAERFRKQPRLHSTLDQLLHHVAVVRFLHGEDGIGTVGLGYQRHELIMCRVLAVEHHKPTFRIGALPVEPRHIVVTGQKLHQPIDGHIGMRDRVGIQPDQHTVLPAVVGQRGDLVREADAVAPEVIDALTPVQPPFSPMCIRCVFMFGFPVGEPRRKPCFEHVAVIQLAEAKPFGVNRQRHVLRPVLPERLHHTLPVIGPTFRAARRNH